jgi:hypothetical protein
MLISAELLVAIDLYNMQKNGKKKSASLLK